MVEQNRLSFSKDTIRLSRKKVQLLVFRAMQKEVFEIWPKVSTENLLELTDFVGYQQGFLKLFGFGLPGVDYAAETELEVPIG